jgi:hypothetical protein
LKNAKVDREQHHYDGEKCCKEPGTGDAMGHFMFVLNRAEILLSDQGLIVFENLQRRIAAAP